MIIMGFQIKRVRFLKYRDFVNQGLKYSSHNLFRRVKIELTLGSVHYSHMSCDMFLLFGVWVCMLSCVCACFCVYMRERERERVRGCVCVCECLCV